MSIPFTIIIDLAFLSDDINNSGKIKDFRFLASSEIFYL